MGIEGDCDFRNIVRQPLPPEIDGNYYFSLRPVASSIWTATTDYNHGDPGIIRFAESRYQVSTTGDVQVKIERPVGASGAVSVTLHTNSTTGDCAMTAGSHFTQVDQVVNFADGEVGVKTVTVSITAIPRNGFNYIELSLDTPTGGVKIFNGRAQIEVDNGLPNPNATIFTETDAATLEATVNAGGGGKLYYFRNTGSSYAYNNRTVGRDWGGYYFQPTGTSATNRNFYMRYPGDNRPKIDQNYAETSDSLGQRTTVGFLSDGASYQCYYGFEITRTLFSGIYTENAVTGTIVRDCLIHNLADPADANAAYNGDLTRADNIGAIGLDQSIQSIIENNIIYEIYDPRPGTGLTNPFTATLYSLHSGIHGFSLREVYIRKNYIHTVEKGVFQKNPYQTGTEMGHLVKDTYFEKIGSSTGTAASAFAAQVAGTGQQGANDNHFADCTLNFSDAGCVNTDGYQVIQFQSDTTTQSTRHYAYNNTMISGRRMFNIGDVTNFVEFSNIADGCDTFLSMNGNSAGGTTVNNINYSNHSRIVEKIILQEDAVSETQYNTLAAYQGAFGGGEAQLQRAAAANSITSAVTYIDSGAGDYSSSSGNTAGAGRFGRDMGGTAVKLVA